MNASAPGGAARTTVGAAWKRYRLYAIVALICLGATGLLWVGLLVQFDVERQRIIESRMEENRNLARVFEEHVSRTMRAAETTLRELKSEYRRVGRGFDLTGYAKQRGTVLDPYNYLSFLDRQGNLVASSLAVPGPVNYRQFDGFQYQSRSGPQTPQPYLSVPYVAPMSGKLTMSLSIPLNQPDEAFDGMALIGMDPSYFSKLYAGFDLGQGSIVTLIGRDGIVRVRSSGAELSAAQDISKSPLFTQLLPRDRVGSYVGPSPVDQVARINSYRALPDFQLVVLIGTSLEAATAAHNQHRLRYMLAASGATLATLGLGLFAMLQIRRGQRDDEARHADDLRAQQALERERDFAQGLIRIAPMLVMLLDTEGRIQHANPSFEQLTGYRLDEIKGNDWFATFLSPPDQERGRAWFKRSGLNQGNGGSILTILTRTGQHREIEWRDRLVHDAGGAVTSVLVTAQDVTARETRDRELERLAAIVRHSSDLVGVFDMDGQIQFLNESGRTLLGLGDELSLLGARLTDLLAAPERTREFADILAAALAQGRWVGELEFRHRGTGAAIPLLFDIFRIDDPASGRPINFGTVSRDLTERKTSEGRLKEAQRIAMVGSWELDLLTDTLVWSDEIFRLFEIDKNQFGATYDAFLEAIHPEDRDWVSRAYVDSLTHRAPYDITHRLLMRDGRVKWVHERCETDFSADGKPLRSLGTVQDITQQQQTELALRESEARYHSVVAALSEGIVLHDKDGSIVAANESALRILSLSMDQMLGRTPVDPLWRAVHEDASPFPGETHPAAVTLRTGKSQTDVVMGVHTPDGRLTWLSINARPIFQPGESLPSSVVVSFVDISERKRAETELRRLNDELEQRVESRTVQLVQARDEADRANAAKSEFLSRMSHELRTPLNAVIGFAQLLESDPQHPLTPDQIDHVEEILRAGDHLLKLINEVLDLSRIESGRLELRIEAVPVLPAVQACLRQLQLMAAQRDLNMTLESDTPDAVLADAMRFKQVVLNLLSNAIKYNRRGGSIHISWTPVVGERLRVVVRDTGRGIPVNALPRLFLPFERFNTADEIIEGSGIGLPLAKNLVEAMHGDIGVTSVAGEGSTFWFELPLAATAA